MDAEDILALISDMSVSEFWKLKSMINELENPPGSASDDEEGNSGVREPRRRPRHPRRPQGSAGSTGAVVWPQAQEEVIESKDAEGETKASIRIVK